MEEPMLALKGCSASDKPKALPNLLPCRIHHTGSVAPVSEYWAPAQSEDLTNVAYFRGRKLQGRAVSLPDDYRGVVVERTLQGHDVEQPRLLAHDQERDGSAETDALQVTAQFEKVLVWSHEASADSSNDPYIRGMSEWLQVAGKVHSFAEPENAGSSQDAGGFGAV